MRLLKFDSCGELSLTKDLVDKIPCYAILSHTWGADDDDEVTFNDIENDLGKNKAGYAKLRFCGEQARKDNLQHFWIDTCCINKANHTELSEAITSMFRWYRDAVKCYVYLSDVTVSSKYSDQSQRPWESDFRKSKWFTRGWTLQELLAPASIEFYSQKGEFLGDKEMLEGLIHEITQIPIPALRGAPLSHFSVDERLQWAEGRNTKRPEDKAYSLLGIFEIYIPLIYGEGENAFNRLREEISKPSNITEYESRCRREFLEALPSLNFDMKHWNVHNECLTGTGQWFLSSKIFETWLEKQGGLLWCPGIPGAGKTVMASIVVEKLQHICTMSKHYVVVYIYFDYALRKQQNLTAIFGDLLAQTLRKQPAISSKIREKFEHLQLSHKNLTKREYLQLLILAFKSFSRIFIVVDALDECTGYDQRAFMSDLQSIDSRNNILVTSRPIDSIAKMFEGGDRVDIVATSDDMEAYVRKYLQDNYELSDMVQEDPNFERRIIATVLKSAQNMFLLLRLHMQSLVCMLSKNEVLQALQTLPKGIDDTYDRAFERIEEQPEWMKRPAINVLTWLSLSCRPLGLTEMRHALSVKSSHRRFDKDNLIPIVHNLASVCAGLVTIDKAGDKISLVHYTTREYLVNHVHLLLSKPHLQMAKTCLTYLSFEDFDLARDRHTTLQEQPFALYASRYWGYHAHEAEQLDPDTHFLALLLLQRDFRTTDTFMFEPIYQDASNADPHRRYIGRDKPNGLHIAAHFGLQAVVLALLEKGANVNCRDANGNTPLHYAAWQGWNSVIEILTKMGADPSPENSRRAVPLQCAAVNGRRDTVNFLVTHGADVNYNPSGPTATFPALHEAIFYDQSDVVDELLQLGADAELLSAERKSSALVCACCCRRAKSLSPLLKHGASVKGENGRQALSKTIRRYYFDDSAQYGKTIAVLCSSDIDLDQHIEGGYNALDLALKFSHGAVIETLLNAKAHTGLDWYRNQPALQKWADQTWFSKLISHSLDAQVSANSSEALQPASFTATIEEYVVFTSPETWQHTSGLYFLWPRPLFFPDIDEITNSDQWQTTQPYTWITVPDNFVRINQISITTESHDQGYSDFYPHAAGTYNNSYTWFDIAFVYHSHPHRTMWVDLIQCNVQSKWDWTTHTNTLSIDDPKDNRDWARADALWNLQAGDDILLYAKAIYQGWENHVRKAEIRLLGMEKKPGDGVRSSNC